MKISSLQLAGMVLAVGLLTGCGQGATSDNGALQNQVTQLASRVETLESNLNQQVSAEDIDQLRAQISDLQATPSSGSNGGPVAASLHIGFVNAEEVFVKYSGTENAIQAYREEKDQVETDLQNLQDQFSAGTISQNEFASQRAELTSKLNSLDQQLTNDITQKIVEAVEAIGKEQGFDLITVRKNVVLYFREGGIVDDLTEVVLAYMNESLTESDE